MDVLTAIMWVAFLTPVIAVLFANKRLAHFITAMLVRVWESIMILFGRRPKPVVEGNVKMSLDEMGMTLEEASDAGYDAEALQKIRDLHALEHRAWDNEFRRIEKVNWMLENDDPDIVDEAETIRDFTGQIIRQSRARKTTKIVHRQGYGLTHKADETCYYCERK